MAKNIGGVFETQCTFGAVCIHHLVHNKVC